MFQIPVKEIIVNDDSQVRLLEDDGTAYADNDVTTTTGGVIFEGFINETIWTSSNAASNATPRGGKASYFNGATNAAKLIKTAFSSGTAEIVDFTITLSASGTAKAGDTYRIVTDTLDLTPVQYQNRPTEKRYQLSVDCGTADLIKTELIARINADPNAQVTASSGGTGILRLTAKKVGVKVGAYVGQYATVGQTSYTVTGALAVNTAAALPIGTYDALKNINWAKNFSIDQNINWMPLPGASYNTYYFEVVSPVITSAYSNTPTPNEVKNNQIYGVRLYVKNGLTLGTSLDLLDTDLATV